MRVLSGATVAIVGFGAIGRQVAHRLRGFACRIIAVTRSGAAEAGADMALAVSQLEEALALADAVVLTLPLSAATRHLLDAQRLAACRRQPVIVNVSRGALIDTGALVAALQSGQIAGAGLDVTDPEPLPTGHPLWTVPNLVLSPHIAAGGGYGLLADFVAGNLERVMQGELPRGLLQSLL
jgi:D-3-phosphoglycerate dehydrogenase